MPPDATTDDRILEAFRALVREVFPRITYMGKFQYVIQRVGDGVVDVAAVDTTIGLPSPLPRVPLLAINGSTVKPVPGSACVVEFLNFDPSLPRVTSMDPVTTQIDLGDAAVPLAKASPFSTLFTAIGTFATAVGVATPAVSGAATTLNAAIALNTPNIPTSIVRGT